MISNVGNSIRNGYTSTPVMLFKSSIARHSIRLASARAAKSDKISVQLLQDCLPLGIKGQIVRVKPAYMRNFLHVDNKACYIVGDQGPRIPVVEKPRAAPVPTAKKVVEEISVKEDSVPVLSLDDLSALFTNARTTNKNENSAALTFTAQAAASSYTLAELDDSLPSTYTINSPVFPISRDFLASTVFNSTGIEIPPTAITVKNANGENVAEIQTPGLYSWTFAVAGKTGSLHRNLNIQ